MEDKDIRKDQEWLDLCEWVEINILGYTDGRKMKTQESLVLRGLTKGQDIANNNREKYGEYSYEIILMTFKIYKNTILNALHGKDFNGSARTKMTYICRIVKDRIDDVYTRYLKANETNKKIETIDMKSRTYKGAEYKSEEKKTNKKLEGLW